MLKLYSRNNKFLSPPTYLNPSILRVTKNVFLPDAIQDKYALLCEDPTTLSKQSNFRYILVVSSNGKETNYPSNTILLDEELSYLDEGDVIKVNPTNNGINSIYRRNANANSFLVTERCNSYCLMCSQPPKNVDDGFLVNEILQAIPLIPRDTKEIGLTGGEPTLVGERFFDMVRSCKQHLPDTSVHVLSNGRTFKDLDFAYKLSQIGHPDLMIGIPLYSDIPQIHEFVVQAKGSFDETISGILNLKRCGVKVEIRCVIHKQTYERLPQLAEFISRNLLFVDHVALMGLEIMGFTRANLDELWIDPVEYQEQLSEAVKILNRNAVFTSVYNHQLCLLPEELHRFSVKSISDWKSEYIDECQKCSKLDECGGFFSSSAKHKYSDHISAFG
ncbi:MAG: His-Xaa-Ser system radical SAM maturase HxsC [Flavobacteriales bacterium]|nr:His-Xaa-Ser system radical SAM maturase HxsC [Flavobacteriales bacterium]